MGLFRSKSSSQQSANNFNSQQRGIGGIQGNIGKKARVSNTTNDNRDFSDRRKFLDKRSFTDSNDHIDNSITEVHVIDGGAFALGESAVSENSRVNIESVSAIKSTSNNAVNATSIGFAHLANTLTGAVSDVLTFAGGAVDKAVKTAEQGSKQAFGFANAISRSDSAETLQAVSRNSMLALLGIAAAVAFVGLRK